MANLFKLNKSQRRFFTCWGKLHVKMAFLVIILVTVFAEILETASYVMVGWHAPSLLTYAIEIWEYIVTISMIVAFIQESSLMMLPFVGQMFVVVVMMLIMFCQILFCVLAPYSSLAEQFFSDAGKYYTLMQREARLLSVFVTVGLFTFVAGWFLNVALATYQYFDYLAMKKTRRVGRANNEQLPVLVQQDALPPQPPAPAQSFPNPNFGNSDDEDEVFQKSQKPGVDIV
ncbi:hypothetical protein Y032_0115g523 [Ancylostoma ceylanicum]|uniref:Uncharacterized protein n=1 Tax=Ancylostoma ceylanicum TaxID=53326 RepID=A0A016TD69_9BILA|nr:hypothetical protein Y032_0115g523 [Ancylostoma ceylanicum]